MDKDTRLTSRNTIQYYMFVDMVTSRPVTHLDISFLDKINIRQNPWIKSL